MLFVFQKKREKVFPGDWDGKVRWPGGPDLNLSGESSLSFLRNMLIVSSMVLPILSLISPSFSLKGKAPLLLSQSSSHFERDSLKSNLSSAAECINRIAVCYAIYTYYNMTIRNKRVNLMSRSYFTQTHWYIFMTTKHIFPTQFKLLCFLLRLFVISIILNGDSY